MLKNTALAGILCASLLAAVCAQEEDVVEERDSSKGLPRDYAATYLVASSTLSPDGKFGVIYPKEEKENGKDFFVAIKPFKILATLETREPYFAHQSHGGVAAQWTKDSSVALIVLDRKWGPGDVLLYEMRDGKLTRATNLLSKVRELLRPDFAEAKPEPYNDSVDFIFNDDMSGDEKQFRLEENGAVRVKAFATTDPKRIGGLRAWDAKFEGTWDTVQANFESQKVTRIFAGKRKDD